MDLADPHTKGKQADSRFVARVLAVEERALLAEAPDPAVELWAFWSAKEAAYKVASKLQAVPPVFAHAAFRVTWRDRALDRWSGSVTHEGVELPVAITRAGTMLHGVATSGAATHDAVLGTEELAAPTSAWKSLFAELLPSFTPREAAAVHSYPSAAVRLRARTGLARVLHVDESALEIVCDPGVTGRRPPRALLDGRPAPADVSLSHHGSWIGWAFLLQNAIGR